MDDADIVMFGEEDFEVVDECVGEEEPSGTNDNKNNETETAATSLTKDETSKSEHVDAAECNVAVEDVENKRPLSDATSDQVHVEDKRGDADENNSIDFTADISFDELNYRKDDMTDEDIMNHLDEIENIVLDSSSFDVQDESEQVDKKPNEEAEQNEAECSKEIVTDVPSVKEDNQNVDSKDDVDIDREEKSKDCEIIDVQKLKDTDDIDKKQESKKPDWYEEKINTKVATVKERLSKLARVLEFSYPCYKGWLERNEALTGSPVCKLDPARCCSLDKPHINRWKFICSRKPVQESTEKDKEDSAAATVNKNVRTVWRLGPSGVLGANIDNSSEFPPFVMRAVKIFEDFLQTTDEPSVVKSTSDNKITEVTIDDDDELSKSQETSTNDEKESASDSKQQWLWLLVRCNRMDELMLFATGRNISSVTMDRLKQVFETGPGKDCKVKSLYCKSIIKIDNTPTSTTTFLVGSEALDETVGGIKIQLAPKTNFWSNAAGAESLGKAVADLLSPSMKTTVVEIGCGIGLIGLMLASRCKKVIGLDTPSEVEEAEMTSELNNVKNASFVMGQPSEVMATIANVLANCKAAAIINANTNIGRAIEVMTGLRKIISLRKLVMVTTLTKQSVRAILELTRPTDDALGNPFVPIRACVVDTLPVGPHFEVVIQMERRIMHKLTQPWIPRVTPKSAVQSTSHSESGLPSTQTAASSSEQSPSNLIKKEKLVLTNVTDNATSIQKLDPSVKKAADKVLPKVIPSPKKGKNTEMTNKKGPLVRNVNAKNASPKNKFKGKRMHSPGKTYLLPKKFVNRFEKPNFKPAWRANKFPPEQRMQDNKSSPMNKSDVIFRKPVQGKTTSPLLSRDGPQKRKRSWSEESALRGNPMNEKKMREHKEQADLRERLSSGRIEPDIIEKVKKQQLLLDMAKQKLSGPTPNVDVATAKQLQNMLSMVIEQTNKLQNQLPRSVWDRIAPPDNAEHSSAAVNVRSQNESLLKGRYVQEMGTEDILITTENRKFLPTNEHIPKMNYSKYNIPPLRPNMVMPITTDDSEGCFQKRTTERYHGVDYRKQNQSGNQWNKDKAMEKNRSWNDMSMSMPSMKKIGSPQRKQVSPFRHRMSPMRRPSPKRPLLSPPRRPCSPPRRYVSPQRRAPSPFRHHVSPQRRQLSPPRRQISPSRRQLSPNRRQMSPSRRQMSPIRHQQLSPPRQGMSQSRRQMSPQRRHMSSPRRGMSPPRRLASPQRIQLSPSRHQLNSPRRVADDWDIPSRGAIEQDNWQRPNERMPDKRWNVERQLPSTSSWDHNLSNERYRKPVNQDKWDIKDSSQEGLWMSGGGDMWNAKQTSVKSSAKEQQWSHGSDGRWQSMSGGPSGDNWNIRGKESFLKPNSRDNEPWADNVKPRWEPLSSKDPWSQADKDDWNDLPEDAKDPWGDDGNCGMKERWQKFENPSTSSSGWIRESDVGDTWSKPNENWQGKGSSVNNKSPWQITSSQSTNESRWLPSNDLSKKILPSGNWQGGSNVSTWQPQNYMGFQQQRSYNPNPFKDRR